MNTKSKLLIIVAVMLLGITMATIVNISLNFREYSINSAIDKAKMTATIVKDGLTAHMVNGIMDKREYFMNKVSVNDGVKALWVVRSESVTKQFGEGLHSESARDAIDAQVLKSGETVKEVQENAEQIFLRITIPYKAESNGGNPNCLSCHDVQREETLGAISMEFDVSAVRNSGLITILKILGINLGFIIVVLFLLNHYITPYTKLFTNLRMGIKKAHSGDFTHKFSTTVGGDAKLIISQMNTLFGKMQETFGDIKYNLATFIPDGCVSSTDPLHEAKTIIGELSDIYKFKKTIELDSSKDMVYVRITDILKTKFEIAHFAFYEVNNLINERKLVYISESDSICFHAVDKSALECRAHRTKTDVISTEFINLCQTCNANELKYTCIPFTINADNSLIISMTARNEEELSRINSHSLSIKNYLEAAKPVIESKILMDKLRDTSLRDGMTGLYNRRFLEEFIDKIMGQAQREKETYSVMMLDVDFFKKVNDTYGHDVGDKVIVAIGNVLKDNIRNSDLAIRYGGEEFVVMLHNATDEGAMEVAQKIHSSFASLIFDVGNGEKMQKTMSIGVSKFPIDGDSIWECIKFADTALYKAKTTGKNKIVVYVHEMSEDEHVR